jgi:hypothetical protein
MYRACGETPFGRLSGCQSPNATPTTYTGRTAMIAKTAPQIVAIRFDKTDLRCQNIELHKALAGPKR